MNDSFLRLRKVFSTRKVNLELINKKMILEPCMQIKSSTEGARRKVSASPGTNHTLGEIPEAEPGTEYPGIQGEKRDQVAYDIRKKGAGREGERRTQSDPTESNPAKWQVSKRAWRNAHLWAKLSPPSSACGTNEITLIVATENFIFHIYH